MKDVFDLIEREQQLSKERQKMIEALQQNHWSENVILRNERDQRVLHEFLVEGKNLTEIAERCGISRERVRQIKDKTKLMLMSYLYRLEHEPPVIEQPYIEPVIIEDFGYDIYEAMVYPDESRIEEVKQLLRTPIEDCDFSIRTLLRLKSAKVSTINDLLVLNFPIDLLKINGFGRKCAVEVEAYVIENGLKFRNQTARREPYVRHTPMGAGDKPTNHERVFTLPVSYPVLNFAWSNEMQLAFKEHNIITIAGLLMARELLAENTKLAPEHFEFIEHRLKEWGLKWK